MWSGDQKRLLSYVLRKVLHPEKLSWVLRRFEGVGEVPYGGSMEEFEEDVLARKFGFELDFADLHAFSEGLHDISEIDLVGWLGNEPVVRIIGEDSTRWVISYRDEWFEPNTRGG